MSARFQWSYWTKAVWDGEAVFLVGAGVSADPPSRLPLAAGLIENLASVIAARVGLPPHIEAKVVRQLTRLRPETAADVFIEHLGASALAPLAHVLQGPPNAWHHLLAAALDHGCSVVTTNFDTLIEQATKSRKGAVAVVANRGQAAAACARSAPPAGILLKLHGSLPFGSRPNLVPLSMSIRHVAHGLPPETSRLLEILVGGRPLIVVGYAGRDDFDIAPALLRLRRTAPTMWLLHDSARLRLLPIARSEHRWKSASQAIACRRAWTQPVHILRGRSQVACTLLSRAIGLPVPPSRNVGMRRRTPVPGPLPRLSRLRATKAIIYGLLEVRAFGTALDVLRHVCQATHTPSAIASLTIDTALVLEKQGRDLKSAQLVANRAITAARATASHRLMAQAFDQRGVIARRRGRHAEADKFYKKGLGCATKRSVPRWLEVQIRAHRAVALDYLKRHSAALHEHRRVLEYERRDGDLRGVGKTLNNLGIVLESLDKPVAAIAHFRQSIELKELLGDARGVAQSMHNLGRLYYRRKMYREAEAEFVTSWRLRTSCDPHGAAQSLIALGRIAQRTRRPRKALMLARKAHAAMRQYGDSRGINQARALIRELTT